MVDQPKKILVVDDVEDWQLTIAGLLTDEKYEAVAVGNREAAIQAVYANEFDMAIIDIRLDETDEDNTAGLDLASEIKRKSSRNNLPVVIITGYETPESIARALRPDETGQSLAANFVRKTDAEELIDIVNEILR